jgi:hypothetical protein
MPGLLSPPAPVAAAAVAATGADLERLFLAVALTAEAMELRRENAIIKRSRKLSHSNFLAIKVGSSIKNS